MRELPNITHIYQNHVLDSTRWNCYHPRPSDIIISTSIKSGTTWMQEIVRQLISLNQNEPALGALPLGEVSPWLDARWHPIDEVIGKLESQQHRRCIKSHLPLDGLPFFPQVKYIVVGRDARDVFMSLWNHHANYTPAFLTFLNDVPGRVGEPFPPCPEDIHIFWKAWISQGWFPWESEGYPYWGNLHHTKTWWQYRSLENILFVHYNDLLNDLTAEIRRVGYFLSLPRVEEALPTVVQAVNINAMRESAEKVDPGKQKIFKDGAQTFFYKGTNGRWKEVLSDEELNLYQVKAAQVLTPGCREWLQQGRAAFAV